MKTLLTTAVVVGILAIGCATPLVSFAASTPTPSCGKLSVSAVEDIKLKSKTDTADTVRSELSVRREALRTVLLCALQEATQLRGHIQDIPDSEEALTQPKQRSVQEISDAIDYYNRQLSKLNDLGIYATKELAAAVKTWRAQTYVLTQQYANNVLLWRRDQILFQTAQHRREQIEQAITSLKISSQQDVADSFAQASQTLAQAQSTHEAILHMLQDQDATPEETFETIKSSLTLLAQTYQHFLVISGIIADVVPHQ